MCTVSSQFYGLGGISLLYPTMEDLKRLSIYVYYMTPHNLITQHVLLLLLLNTLAKISVINIVNHCYILHFLGGLAYILHLLLYFSALLV